MTRKESTHPSPTDDGPTTGLAPGRTRRRPETGAPDGLIIHWIRSGEPSAHDLGWRLLIEKYSPVMLATALDVLGNLQDAEDAAQRAWTAVIRGLIGYEEQGRLREWLCTITYREAQSVRRSRDRGGAVAESALGAAGFAAIPDPRGGEGSILVDIDFARALEKMNVGQREIIVRHGLYGEPTASIARERGQSDESVRVAYSRALRKLGELLQEKG